MWQRFLSVPPMTGLQFVSPVVTLRTVCLTNDHWQFITTVCPLPWKWRSLSHLCLWHIRATLQLPPQGDNKEVIVETTSFSLPPKTEKIRQASDCALLFLGARAPSTFTSCLMGTDRE